MRWTAFNVVGALAWVGGLVYARDAELPDANIFTAVDHRFLIGMSVGLVGLAVLLWTNLRNTT